MKYSGIGGQAVMEGVMMKNKDFYAVAVRKSNQAAEALSQKEEIMERDDYLLKQIDEFREKAKQLQELIATKESRARELQRVVDEEQSKAYELKSLDAKTFSETR